MSGLRAFTWVHWQLSRSALCSTLFAGSWRKVHLIRHACVSASSFCDRQGYSRDTAEVRGGRCGCWGLRWCVPRVVCACTLVSVAPFCSFELLVLAACSPLRRARGAIAAFRSQLGLHFRHSVVGVSPHLTRCLWSCLCGVSHIAGCCLRLCLTTPFGCRSA